MSQQGLGSECQGSGLPKVGHQWGLRVFIWGRFHLGRWNGIHKSDTVTLGRVGPLSSLPRCPYLPHRVRMLTWVQPGGNSPTGPADPRRGGGGELRVCPLGLGSLCGWGSPGTCVSLCWCCVCSRRDPAQNRKRERSY